MAKKTRVETSEGKPVQTLNSDNLEKYLIEQDSKAIKEGKIPDPKVVKELTGNVDTDIPFEMMRSYPVQDSKDYEKYKGYVSESLLKSKQLDFNELDKIAAESQGFSDALWEKTKQVATNIVPQILSGAASMLDIQGYWDAEHAAQNSIVNWANEVKEQSSKDNPIFRKDPSGQMDMGDSAWWIDFMGDLVESISSFAVTGMGAGLLTKGLGASAKALGAQKLLKAVGASGKTRNAIGQGTSTLATATMMNQAEAVMEASHVYKDIYEDRLSKGYSVEDAKRYAGNAAATTMNINRMNILLNLTSAKLFISPLTKQRELIKAITTGHGLREVVKESGQEGLEEIINLIAEKTGTAVGKGKHQRSNILDDWGFALEHIKDAKSMEGLEAYFLGAIGGAGQTGLTLAGRHSKYGPGNTKDEAGNRISAVASQKQNYAKQQKVIEELKKKGVKTTDALMNAVDQQKFKDDLEVASKDLENGVEGSKERVEALQDKLFSVTAYRAFESGTQAVIDGMLDETIANTNTSKVEKERAIQAKKQLKDLEDIYYNTEEYENPMEVYKNRANYHLFKNNLTLKQAEVAEHQARAAQAVEEIAKKYTLFKEDILFDESKSGQEKLSRELGEIPLLLSLENSTNPYEGIPGEVAEANSKIWEQAQEEIDNNPTVKKYFEEKEKEEKLKKTLKKNNDDFAKLTSKEEQKIAKQEKITNALNKEIEEKVDEAKSISELRKLKSQTTDKRLHSIIENRIKGIENDKINQKAENKLQEEIKSYDTILDTLRREDVTQLESLREEIEGHTFTQDFVRNEEIKEELLKRIEAKLDGQESEKPLPENIVKNKKNIENLNKRIKLLKKKKELLEKDDQDIEDTLEYLNELLNETNELTSVEVDKILKNVQQLESLIQSNSKKVSKRGQQTLSIISDLKKSLKEEFKINNDIFNRIRTLKNTSEQILKPIVKDLNNQIKYYESLIADPSMKTFGKQEFEQKIKKIKKKISTIQKLIELIQKAISQSVNYLKEFVKSYHSAYNKLKSFKDTTSFEQLSAEKYRSLLNSANENDQALVDLKHIHDKLEKDVLKSIDDIEILEEVETVERKRLDELQNKLTVYHNQVRYLEELLQPIQEEIRQEPTSSFTPGVTNEVEEIIAEKPEPELEVKKEEIVVKTLFEINDDLEKANKELQEASSQLKKDTDAFSAFQNVDEDGNPINEEEDEQGNPINVSKEEAQQSEKVQDDLEVPEDYTTLKDDEQTYQENVLNLLQEALFSNNGGEFKNNGDINFAYPKSREAHNKGAFLSREYLQLYDELSGVVTREETTNEVINKQVLHPDNFKKGTKITLSVQEDYSGDIYDSKDFTLSKKKILWSTRLQEIKKLADERGVDYRTTQEYINEVPVIAKDSTGNHFYIHDVTWISKENISDDVTDAEMEEDIAKLQQIRQAIISKGSVETKILEKSIGTFLRSTSPLSVSEAFPKGNRQFGIVTERDGTIASINNSKSVLKNDSTAIFKKGTLVNIITVGTKKIAIALKRSKVTEQTAETLYQVTRLWLNQNNLTEEDKQLLADIKKETNIDIINPTNPQGTAGLKQFFEAYIYLHGHNGIKKQLNSESTKYSKDESIFAITGNSIEFGQPNSKAINPVFITLNDASLKPEELAKKLSFLKASLQKTSTNASFSVGKNNPEKTIIQIQDKKVSSIPYEDFLGDSFTSEIYSVNVGTEDKPVFISNIQPTVEYDVVPLLQAPKVEKENVESTIPEDKNTLELAIQNKELALEIAEEEDKVRLQLEKTQLEQKLKDVEKEKPFVNPLLKAKKKQEEVEPDDSDAEDFILDTIEEKETREKTLQDQVEIELSELKLPKVPSALQKDSINYISSLLFQELISNKDKTGKDTLSATKVNEIFNTFENNLKDIIEYYKSKNLVNKAKNLQAILDNYSLFKRLVEKNLKKLGTVSLESEEALGDDNEQGGLIKENFSDEFNLTLDSKTTSSIDLKRFFASVRSLDTTGEEQTNNMVPVIIPFDEVYNTLHETLANLASDYNLMISKLKEKQNVFPWYGQVIEMLEEAPQKIKEEFVSDMTKHTVDMEFVHWSEQKGSFSLDIWSSNSSAKEQRIRSLWRSNMQSDIGQSPIVTVNEDGEYIYDEKIAKLLVEQVNEWNKTRTFPVIFDSNDNFIEGNELQHWLGKLGITLSEATYKDLVKGNYKVGNRKIKYEDLFNKQKGFISILTNELENIKKDSLVSENDILNDTVVKNLAKLEATNNTSYLSNSFNAGMKTIYSYTNNKWLTNRFRDILDDEQLLKDLQSLSFSADSLWLEQLSNVNTKNDVVGLMKLTYLSLEANKRRGGKSKDNKKLNQIATIEHEFTKMGFFFNNTTQELVLEKGTENESDTTVKFRKVGYFYPTTSDKSNTHIVHHLAKEITLEDTTTGENGLKTVSMEDVKYYYKGVVLPEVRRMISDKRPTTVKGNHVDAFYFSPELNTKTFLHEGQEKTVLEIIQDTKDETVIQELLLPYLQQEYIPKRILQKLKDWETLGVMDKKGVNTFINNRYSTVKGATKLGTIHAAADYLLNYDIANAEMFKLFIGDPSQYAKWNNKKSVTENLKATYDNISKRLAGDVGPGVELANTKNSNYTQVFFKDAFNGSLNTLDKIQKDYFDSIDSNYSTNYGKREKGKGIEGTDAQEFTTWREHLFVLQKLGRLTDAQYKRIFSTLSAGKKLNYSDVQLVLQPMKPLYVGNSIDIEQNIDRRVYVKSSSFPLIPQLTATLQIDKIRVELEKYENRYNDPETGQHGSISPNGDPHTVRAVFGTGIKIGSVNDVIDVFDENGNVLDFTIEESNTLILKRENFRIQQDVPYDKDKTEINAGSQEQSLLFNNLLDVDGFSFGGKNNLTGAELQSIYYDTYEKLFQYKHKKFREDIGLDMVVDTQEDLNLETSEDSIFHKLDKKMTAVEKAKNKEEIKRAEYINANFDDILKQLLKNKVNVFFQEEFERKGDCKKL